MFWREFRSFGGVRSDGASKLHWWMSKFSHTTQVVTQNSVGAAAGGARQHTPVARWSTFLRSNMALRLLFQRPLRLSLLLVVAIVSFDGRDGIVEAFRPSSFRQFRQTTNRANLLQKPMTPELPTTTATLLQSSGSRRQKIRKYLG